MLEKYFRKVTFLIQVLCRYSNGAEILFNSHKQTVKKIYLRNGVVFTGNTSSQLQAITDEIFFNRVYFHDRVAIERGDIVVDIGANVGIFSTFAMTQGAKHVYSYEPFPENVALIKKNLKLNHFKAATVIQAAVSDKKGKAKLYLGDVDAGNLLFDHNVKGKLTKYISVPTVTLEGIFKSQHLTKIDFLKIDCEGSEGAIIKNTSDSVWKKIDKVALEFHDNVSLLSHKQLQQKFKKFGFKTYLAYDGSSPFGYIYAWKS